MPTHDRSASSGLYGTATHFRSGLNGRVRKRWSTELKGEGAGSIGRAGAFSYGGSRRSLFTESVATAGACAGSTARCTQRLLAPTWRSVPGSEEAIPSWPGSHMGSFRAGAGRRGRVRSRPSRPRHDDSGRHPNDYAGRGRARYAGRRRAGRQIGPARRVPGSAGPATTTRSSSGSSWASGAVAGRRAPTRRSRASRGAFGLHAASLSQDRAGCGRDARS